MIVEWLLDALESALLWIASLLPESDDVGSAFSGIGTVLGHIGALNYFLPIGEMFTFVIGVLAIFPALAGVSLILWVVGIIRGASVRG